MFIKAKATPGVNSVIKAASSAAKEFNDNNIATEHILYGLALNKDSVAGKILNRYNVSSLEILKIFNDSKNKKSGDQGAINLTNKAERIFKVANTIRNDLGDEFLSTEHLLISIITDDSSVATSILKLHFNIELDTLKNDLGSRHINKDAKPINGVNQHEEKSLPAELLSMGTDLTLRAKEGKIDKVIGRIKEVEELIEVLLRKSKSNPVIVGSPGVGKTSLVNALALKIVDEDVPNSLKDKIIFSLDIGSFMAGTQYRGALEEKLKNAIKVILEREDIILYIDEIHTIMQIGEGGGEVKTADILKPHLENSGIKVIGSTTFSEYSKYIEKDKALERRFQKVIVSEPSRDDTLAILKGIKKNYEKHYSITIDDKLLESVIEFSDKYIQDRNFPDKAIDLLDAACSNSINKSDNQQRQKNHIIKDIDNLILSKETYLKESNFEKATETSDEINKKEEELLRLTESLKDTDEKSTLKLDNLANIINSWTKIPVSKITEEEGRDLVKLEDKIKERIIGQDEAVKVVAQAIRRSRLGIRDENKPIGTFIFLGQTGVGKTELCKSLAKAVFGDQKDIIRFDMADYMDKSSVSNLIGSAKGLVGSEDGGLLINSVKEKPYSIILFDEMEKADLEIYNILLPVLDEGYIKDSKGNKVSFKNTIIIFTSNLGIEELNEECKYKKLTKQESDDFLLVRMKKKFKPEFLNRIDKAIMFNNLNYEDTARIAKIMLTELNDLIMLRGYKPFKITEEAFKHIVFSAKGSGGARDLKRFIVKNISDAITNEIISRNISTESNIIIGFENKKIKLIY